jgi:hypothetical protein
LRQENLHPGFPGEDIAAVNMIVVLVGNEYAPQFGQRKPEPVHPFDNLFAAHARVDQYGVVAFFQIIAVAVAAGRQRSNFQNPFTFRNLSTCAFRRWPAGKTLLHFLFMPFRPKKETFLPDQREAP